MPPPLPPPALGSADALPPSDAPSGLGEPARLVPLPLPPLEEIQLPPRCSPFLAGALGWLVPGLGQVYLGRLGAGFLLLLVIVGTFAGGLALTDFTGVDPDAYSLEFVAHALIGGPTALALHLTHGLHLERARPWLEIGHLFAVVAGILNLVAILDAVREALVRAAARREAEDVRRAWALPPRADEPARTLAAPGSGGGS